MYLREIRIENIRSIKEIEWRVPAEKADGWHVIIGDNGSGKSTFLRSIALVLMGPGEASKLRLDLLELIKKDAERGSIELKLEITLDSDDADAQAGNGLPKRVSPHEAGIKLEIDRDRRGQFLRVRLTPEQRAQRLVIGDAESANFGPFNVGKWSLDRIERGIWEDDYEAFSSAFGPYRRLVGGDTETPRISHRLDRFLSIFDERHVLTDCIKWLQLLRFQQLENREGAESREADQGLLPRIFEFINQPDFLPHKARLKEIRSDAVLFEDGNVMEVRIEDLSDGYRSILSMTLELIRQLALAFGPDRVFETGDCTKVACAGVVLIDEIDVHLHPTWQRQIGLFLRKHFPKIQFIVTTHSPLICQAADVGTVFVLPKPGEEGRGEMLKGAKLDRLLYGNVLDAYGTEVFGREVGRSEEAKKKLKRLATLNVKETRQGLTKAESKEQERLRGAMPTASLTRDPCDDSDS